MAMATVSFDDTEVAFAGKDDAELAKSAWLFRIMSNSTIVDIGSHITQLALQIGLPVDTILKSTIFEHFCGGESLEETAAMVSALSSHQVSTILDYGVEAKETQDEFDANLGEQLRCIEFADAQAAVPYVSCKITGYAPFALLERLNAGQTLTDEDQLAHSRMMERLTLICAAAARRDVAVYMDAEESWIQDAIDTVVEDLMARFNRAKPSVFNTVQLYRHDRLAYLKASHRRAVAGGYLLGVKLVRGAYMEKERARAQSRGLPSPIHESKAAVDADFDAGTGQWGVPSALPVNEFHVAAWRVPGRRHLLTRIATTTTHWVLEDGASAWGNAKAPTGMSRRSDALSVSIGGTLYVIGGIENGIAQTSVDVFTWS